MCKLPNGCNPTTRNYSTISFTIAQNKKFTGFETDEQESSRSASYSSWPKLFYAKCSNTFTYIFRISTRSIESELFKIQTGKEHETVTKIPGLIPIYCTYVHISSGYRTIR